jgi:hypothetical protein
MMVWRKSEKKIKMNLRCTRSTSSTRTNEKMKNSHPHVSQVPHVPQVRNRGSRPRKKVNKSACESFGKLPDESLFPLPLVCTVRFIPCGRLSEAKPIGLSEASRRTPVWAKSVGG